MLWLEKRKAILMSSEEYRKATEGYKMSSGAVSQYCLFLNKVDT